MTQPKSNRLIQSHSPYLLQHAHNPVDWYPWGEEAFSLAQRENKLVFLSIGYSTCHWCHVMAHESFEDAEVAALLNRDYIAIKVDREERPDVDAVYMSVCQTLTGQGGWPLTVILTPQQFPLHAATYLPKRSTPYAVGLMELLPALAAEWRARGDRLTHAAVNVREIVQQEQDLARGTVRAPHDLLQSAIGYFRHNFDRR